MRLYFLSFLKGLIHSKVYISLAAVMLILETQILLGQQPKFYPYVFLIFFATFFEYNFHCITVFLFKSGRLNTSRDIWVQQNQNVFYSLLCIFGSGLLISLGFAQGKILLSMVPAFLLTWFYSAPFEWPEFGFLKLRNIPFLKIFIISAVWSAITVIIPVIHADKNGILETLLLFAERFLFIFAITIPFDIRDMQADAQGGLRTIPLYLGAKKSVLLASALMVLSIGTSFLHFMIVGRSFIAFGILLSGVIVFCCLRLTFLQKMPLYHYGILDGTMILQGGLLWLFFLCEKF